MKNLFIMSGLILFCASLAVGSGLGQDKKDAQPPAKGKLPTGWTKLGLTADQKKKVYSINATYQAKIDDLKAQIDQLKKDEYAEQVKVLTTEQFEQLKKIATEKIDQGKDDKKKIDDKKVDDKKG